MIMNKGKFHAIVDSSWGSSGKSAVSTRIVDLLGIKNVSSNNNPNAGHTVVKDGDEFVFKSLPGPAILKGWEMDRAYGESNGITSYIGPNSAFDIDQFHKEVEKTKSTIGQDLFIHSRAAITEQHHRDAEGPNGSMSTLHISSTMSGAGATYAMKAMRMLNTKYAEDIPSLSSGVLQPWDFYDKIQLSLMRGEDFMHEVSQGFALSLDYGTHSRTCTFRNVTPQQAYADFLIHPHQVGDVYLNLRTFPIRVGNNFDADGNMVGYSGDWMSDQEELDWLQIGKMAGMPKEELDILAEKERTTVTKKIRRVANFSFDLLRYSAKMCGATKLVLNFTSYLDWASTDKYGGTDEYRKLSRIVRDFVDKLETATGLPVVMLGTGREHNSYILPYDGV
jgi:adenylosuccinate synthase